MLVSRQDLPGARASTRLGLRVRVAQESEHKPGAAPGELPGTATAPAVAEELRRSLRPAAKKERPQPLQRRHADSESRQTPADPAARERFSVAAVISAGRLWLEDLQQDALAREQVQLMVAIGRALDHPTVDTAKPMVTQFDWPLSSNPQLDMGPAEARAALAGFLRRQLAEHGLREVMCCGESAEQRLQGCEMPVPMHRLPETRALLEAPLQKRDLWRALSR